jgi:hypothetical protein
MTFQLLLEQLINMLCSNCVIYKIDKQIVVVAKKQYNTSCSGTQNMQANLWRCQKKKVNF